MAHGKNRLPSTRNLKSNIIPIHSDFNVAKDSLVEYDNGTPVMFPYNLNDEPSPFDSTKEFHVDHLKNQFADVARPNMFKINIFPPSPLMNDWDNSKSGLMALAKSTKIPSITVKEYLYERAGQKLYIPNGEVEHGEASITFINDSNFTIRTMFNRWMRLGLMNYESNIGSIPALALQGQVVIYHYDYDLKPTYMVKLLNAWPSSLSAIELSQESENTPEEFTVDFKYSYQEIYKNFDGKN